MEFKHRPIMVKTYYSTIWGKGLYMFLNTPTWETESLGGKEEVNCHAFPALRKAEVPHLKRRTPTFGSAPFFFPTPKFNIVLKLQTMKYLYCLKSH